MSESRTLTQLPMFLSNVALDGNRPTFFEIVMQERLMDSLKPALQHALLVLSESYPRLIHASLNFEEVYFLLMFGIQRYYLQNYDASVAEHLFALKRVRQPQSEGLGETQQPPSALTPQSRNASLVVLVVLPYIRVKMLKLYEQYAGVLTPFGRSPPTNQRVPDPPTVGPLSTPPPAATTPSTHTTSATSSPEPSNSENTSSATAAQAAAAAATVAPVPVAAGGGGGEAQSRNEGDIGTRSGSDGSSSSGGTDAVSSSTSSGATREAMKQRVLVWVRRLFVSLFPVAHASAEMASLMQQCLYLFGHSQFSSVGRRAVGQSLVRLSQDDLAQLTADPTPARRAALAALAPPPLDPSSSSHPLPSSVASRLTALVVGLSRGLRRAALRVSWGVVDNSSFFLLALMVGFKAVEWWHVEGREGAAALTASRGVGGGGGGGLEGWAAGWGGGGDVPPPTGPKPSKSPTAVPLTPDRGQCPLCLNPRTNPTLSSSGHVFCYPCLFKYVASHRSCPVTAQPCALTQLRRIFEDA